MAFTSRGALRTVKRTGVLLIIPVAKVRDVPPKVLDISRAYALSLPVGWRPVGERRQIEAHVE